MNKKSTCLFHSRNLGSPNLTSQSLPSTIDRINASNSSTHYSAGLNKVIKSLIILLLLFSQISIAQSTQKFKSSGLLHQDKLSIDAKIQSIENGSVTDITNNVGKILSFAQDTAVYIGQFQSLQDQKILDWISENQGEMHFNIEKRFQFDNMFNQISWPKYVEHQKNKYLHIIQFGQNQPFSWQLNQNDTKLQQFNPIYTIWASLLNPKYVTQQVLTLQFTFNPKKLKQPTPPSEPQLGQQSCLLVDQNQWVCSFTRMNYTKLWRRSSLDDDMHVLNISYRMKIDAKQNTNSQYDYEEFKIQFEIMDIHLAEQKGNVKEQNILQPMQMIRLRTRQPLVLRDRRLQVSMFCLFVAILAGIQIHSALKINARLLLQPALSCKISLFTISYCTISDLSSTIDFAYRVFQTQSNFNRLFYILPTLVYTFLYFGFDIQLLTRVLITQFNNRAFNIAGDNNASFKKILLVFYIAFFFSYEGLVIMKAFFQYQWWLILITSLCIFVPQIVRNVRIGNGGDNRFDYWYILGFLGSRTLFVLYEHACPQNYEKIKPYLWLALLLSSLFLIQVTILFLQSKLGARFFIPKFLRPAQYDYSYKLKYAEQDNVDNLECAICIHSLFEELDEQDNGQNLNESQKVDLQKKILDEVTVFKTPCGHMFHEECLKSWAQIKLQCPSCRQKLPVF